MKIFMSHFKYNNLQISGQLFLGNFHQFSRLKEKSYLEILF